MSEPKEELAVTVYSSDPALGSPGALLGGLWDDLFKSRELVWMLFTRNLRAQFRQTLLGYLWLFLPPIATAAIWFFLHSQKILRVETAIPYPIFVLVGVTLWTSFSNLTRAPLTGFTSGKQVLVKLNVPVEAFLLSSVLSCLVEFLIRSAILIPFMMLMNYPIPATAPLYLVGSLFLFLPALAIGVLIVPLGSLYNDFGNVLTNVVRPLMYLTPVVYPVTAKGSWLREVMRLNPLTPPMDFARDVLTTGSFEWFVPSAIVAGVSLLLLILGFILMRIAKPHLIVRMGM
jgi:lipopolysaccharide transport system permease protein